ncbi:MAG: hypothetical protein R2877_03895 [Bdellovibrionota bacterium]
MTFWERYKLAWNRRVPFYRIIGPLLLVFGLVRLYPLANLWIGSHEAIGRVVDVIATTGTCDAGRRTYYECTKFNAKVAYSVDPSKKYVIDAKAGDTKGYNQPIELANLKKGDVVRVLHNQKLMQAFPAKELYGHIRFFLIPFFFGIFFTIAGYWKYLKRTSPVNLTSVT